jgi:uncharacterized RDD family membrane protein YckC
MDGEAPGSAARPREYAGLRHRILAAWIDLLLLCAIFFPVTRIVKGTWIMSAQDHRWSRGLFVTDPLCLAFLLGMFLYFVFLEGLAGTTPGKGLMGLRVVGAHDSGPVGTHGLRVIDTRGPRAGLRKALIRNILRVIDGLPTLGILGIALIATSRERTRFGDRIAGTRVIQDPGGRRAFLQARSTRRCLLALLAILLALVHFLLPPNREAIRFARARIALFPAEWSQYRDERDPEQRLRSNYGMNYDAPIFIRDNLGADDRLQLPPRAYVAPYCRPGEDQWVDPRAVAYVAGPVKVFAWLGAVRPEATHALVVDTLGVTPGLRIVTLESPADREQIAALYRRAERRIR